MHKINKNQLRTIQGIFANFFISNTEEGAYTSSISDVKIYCKENDENLYISYVNRYVQVEGPTYDVYYLKIDSDGNCETLFPLHNSNDPIRPLQLKIEKMFNEMTMVNFNTTLATWYREMQQQNSQI